MKSGKPNGHVMRKADVKTPLSSSKHDCEQMYSDYGYLGSQFASELVYPWDGNIELLCDWEMVAKDVR